MPDIIITLDSDEQLAGIENEITGPETATLTEADFVETANDDGTYTYEATHAVSLDGEYTTTLQTMLDAAGNDGADGESVTVTVGTPDDGSTDDGSTVTVDDYESGNLSAYAGDMSGYEVQSEVVKDGSYALAGSTDGSSVNPYIQSTDGLNAYPSPGDTFRVWMRADRIIGNMQTSFGATDTNNRYIVLLHFHTGTFRLSCRSNGSTTHFDTPSVDYEADTWYEVRIDWGTDGTITATLYSESGTELASITEVDTTFTSGGIGMFTVENSSSQTGYWDGLEIDNR